MGLSQRLAMRSRRRDALMAPFEGIFLDRSAGFSGIWRHLAKSCSSSLAGMDAAIGPWPGRLYGAAHPIGTNFIPVQELSSHVLRRECY